MNKILVRELIETDCETISRAFAAQGWNKPLSKYLRYLEESLEGRRTVLVAEYQNQVAGYVTIVWGSDYPPFKTLQIPEIVDFNVLIKYRRQGIGRTLMNEAERRIATNHKTVGISVGLTSDYGAAQIMYVKRGYVPDGHGISKDGTTLNLGSHAIVDHDLTLHLTKTLSD
ncbi:MAG: GNAT family N-acetyltransferase [Chloroflexi bacterium]|nr:GNAT family N-acetyltransferase [Chloroflexota bacterium]MBI5082969.1 GNAT family N-acetyltransferase [Chloroflexota bacterium]